MISRILLITTGGTIAGEVAASKRDSSWSQIKAAGFAELLREVVSHLREKIDIELLIEPYEFSEIDSSDVSLEHWMGLVSLIEKKYDDFDSFIVTHGTNTLGYTSAALSFALHNNAKPVVLTGSQVPFGVPGSDARANLDNAIRIACWPRHSIHGVVAVFGSHIISGTRVKKATEFDYDAFQSFSSSSLGRIGRIVDINAANLNAHNQYLSGPGYPLAKSKSQLRIDNRFLGDVISLTEFPGMKADLFKALVNEHDTKGFILRAFGAGDVASWMRDGLKYLKEREIPIVITTQAPNGNANMQVNEPGQYVRENGLGIPAYDMGIEAQTAKLMWLLARKENKEITYQQLCEQMIVDLRGEIRVMWEDAYSV